MVSTPRLHLSTAALRDEASLIAAARAGDRVAQEQLVRRYLRDVYEVALRILRDPDMAQDAAQDAIVSALNGLAGFRGDASFRTWLLRITVNAARSLGRRSGRRREVPLAVVEEQPADEPDPASAAVSRTEADRAVALLAGLPPKQRLAVTLRTRQGLSYREIGKVLECSEGAARVNYHLGIKRLRESLQ